MYMTGFKCFTCGSEQPGDFGGYLCPGCDGNLEITYDYSAMSKTVTKGFGNGSKGMFRYQALLPVEEPVEGFPLKVGGTPLYRASRLGRSAGLNHVFLKDDSVNPSASFKDRAGTVALCAAMGRGANTVATASTGNAGSSMACLAAALGLDAIVFVPESAPEAKLVQLLAYGAQVLAVRGTYDDAYDLCHEACNEFGWFNRSTGYNPYTREGKKTVAFEIWEDLGSEVPDRVVVPTGDGNIISGVWKGWKDLQRVGLIDRLPKIDCAQSNASDAVSRTVRRLRNSGDTMPDWSKVGIEQVKATTLADSISVDRPRDGLAAVRAVIESGGEAVSVSDESILEAAKEMAQLSGVFPEPAAATPWAALKQLTADGMVKPNERVVCLVTGSGLKDIASAVRSVEKPLYIDPVLEAVRQALQTRD